jgi:hypothetical protein
VPPDKGIELLNEPGEDTACGEQYVILDLVQLRIALLCVLLYADDVVLMAESEEELQSLLNQLKLFCDESQLMLNIKKTKCLIFEKRQCSLTTSLDFQFDGKSRSLSPWAVGSPFLGYLAIRNVFVAVPGSSTSC